MRQHAATGAEPVDDQAALLDDQATLLEDQARVRAALGAGTTGTDLDTVAAPADISPSDFDTAPSDFGGPSVADRTRVRALVGGGVLLSMATIATNAGNYALNLVLARWLSPAAFADANLMVTIMLLVAAVAASLQLVAARFAGVHHARDDFASAAAVGSWLDRQARWSGVALALAIAVPARFWASVLHVESPWYFVIVAVGVPFYLIQAVRRGLMLGALRYGKVAATFVVETGVRVGVSVALVALGFGVGGATVGLALSFLVTGAVASRMQPVHGHELIAGAARREIWAYIAPVGVVLAGQILINNGDVMIVKATFEGHDAGIYAAIALMGRAVFFVSWAAVTTLFPATTQRSEAGGASSAMVFVGGGVVAAMGAVLTVLAWVLGEPVFVLALGSEYGGIRPYLTSYALATTLFAVANMMVSQRLSMGQTKHAVLLLAGAVVQTAGLLAFHQDTTTVIRVQLIAMSALLAVVIVANVRDWYSERHR